MIQQNAVSISFTSVFFLRFGILEQFRQQLAINIVMQKDQGKKPVESCSREFLKRETGKKEKIKAPKK